MNMTHCLENLIVHINMNLFLQNIYPLHYSLRTSKFNVRCRANLFLDNIVIGLCNHQVSHKPITVTLITLCCDNITNTAMYEHVFDVSICCHFIAMGGYCVTAIDNSICIIQVVNGKQPVALSLIH